LALKPAIAHEALSAGDVERDHHSVPGFQSVDRCAHFFDHTHRFVAEDVALAHECAEHLVEMQV
jgi:hypothetical protein